MNKVRAYLAEKSVELAAHPFFSRLDQKLPFENAMDFVAGVTFWVFTFQDILSINEARVVDPELRRIARHHRSEDRGHELWFLEDLADLDPTPRDFRWLFGPHHAQTRDASHALMSEVFRASDDFVRIALLLTLESAGHMSFERMAKYVDQHEPNTKLRYFSRSHLEVEKAHELYEDEMMKVLDRELSAPVRAEAIAMVDRCYDAFTLLFSGLVNRTERRATGALSVRPTSVHPTNA